MRAVSSAFAAAAIAAVLSGCIDRANTPMLVPVGTPVQPAAVVHTLCVGDANAAYNRAQEEFRKRARMSGRYSLTSQDGFDEESQAKSAARMKYMSCVASQGYKALY
jgi:hypothetical protein